MVRIEDLLKEGDPLELAAIGAALDTFDMAEDDSMENKRPLKENEIQRLIESIKEL